MGAFYQPKRPPDSDRPALPIVHALDESFRGKLAPVDYPCLYCAKVCTSPQALATHRAMKHASLVAFVIAALRCVVLRCVAPPPWWGGPATLVSLI
jgi:hypothetical protein